MVEVILGSAILIAFMSWWAYFFTMTLPFDRFYSKHEREVYIKYSAYAHCHTVCPRCGARPRQFCRLWPYLFGAW